MPQLRLVKVIVQPVFVLDHGTHIEEIEHPAVAIPSQDWPTYSSERFPAEVKAWQSQLDAEARASEECKPPRTRPKR
ncbi:MAG: hypothetical protein ACLPZR_08095 [Solirubrobacteraceae bacterium]